MSDRPVEITFAQMRNNDVCRILIYCCDDMCSHAIAISDDA
jgi:hypothetical protein